MINTVEEFFSILESMPDRGWQFVPGIRKGGKIRDKDGYCPICAVAHHNGIFNGDQIRKYYNTFGFIKSDIDVDLLFAKQDVGLLLDMYPDFIDDYVASTIVAAADLAKANYRKELEKVVGL